MSQRRGEERRGERTEAILKDQSVGPKKSKFGDTLLPLSRDKISKLETFHGNGLRLGGRVLEILHLDAETEP